MGLALFWLTHPYLGNSGQNANPAAEPQTKDQKAGSISRQINDTTFWGMCVIGW